MRMLWNLVWAAVLALSASAQAGGGFRVSGTVVNSLTGQPVAQARVRLVPTQEMDKSSVVIATDAGQFAFDNVAAGKYALVAGKPGYLIEAFNEHEQYSTAIAVGRPGLKTEDLIFRLHPEAIISGQVTDEQNEPVPEADAVLFQYFLRDGERKITQREQTKTDDRGLYRFSGLSPGTYFVVISARPWYTQYLQPAPAEAADGAQPDLPDKNSQLDLTYPLTYYSGVTDPESATPLKLAAGDRISADIRLVPTPALHIRVKAPNLDPNQGFSAVITPKTFNGAILPTPLPAQTTMPQPGELRIGGIAPGRYHLQLVFPGKQTSSYDQDLDLESNTEIDAASNNAAADISGVVKFQDGSPAPPGAAILLTSEMSSSAVAQISQNGEFRFDQGTTLPPGKYDVHIARVPDIAFQSISARGARVSGRKVELTGSGPVRLTVTLARGLGRITGTAVSSKDGAPVAGAMVLLVPQNPETDPALVRRDQSDSDGTFTLPSVRPGRYRLLAIQNGWDLEWMNPQVLQPYLAAGAAVEVEKDRTYNLTVRVQ